MTAPTAMPSCNSFLARTCRNAQNHEHQQCCQNHLEHERLHCGTCRHGRSKCRALGKQKSQHNTSHESTSALTHDIRNYASCFKPPCGEKPDRHGGINVRTRDVSNRVNHRQHDEAESKCHSHMRHRAAGYAIDHDRAGAGEHEAERSQKFCD